MSTPPTPNTNTIDEAVSEVKGLESQVSQDQTTIAGDNAQIATEEAASLSLHQQLAATQQSLIAAESILQRKPVIYAGLEKFGLFTADKKIPFQWIQPGNTGNSGGGSPLSHGTETWTP